MTDGSPVDAEVASVQCNQGSTDVCVADIKLLGRFFCDEVPGHLTVSGEVVLDLAGGGTTTRRLSGADLAIDLDEGNQEGFRPVESTEEASFNVSIKLLSGDESSTFLYGRVLLSTLGVIAGTLVLF